MFRSNSRLGVKSSKNGKRLISHPKQRETANVNMGGDFTGGSSGLSFSAIGASQRENKDLFLTGIVNDKQKRTINLFLEDIYKYDPYCGSAVDLTSTLPFSDFSLRGAKENQLDVHMSSIERLDLKNRNPTISANMLVFAEYVSTLVYSSKQKIFTDMLEYDHTQTEMQYLPFSSMEPVITVRPDAEFKEFINSSEEHIQKLRKHIPQSMLDSMSGGEFVLDPLTTLYLARTPINRNKPISYLQRVIPIYLMEKSLLRGTLTEASKRQRAFFHAACLTGDTLVTTNDGLVRIDELVSHDTDDKPFSIELDVPVKSYDGKFHNTIAWHYRGKKETISVITSSGREINCTPDHKIQTLTENGDFEWVEAKDLENQLVCVSGKGDFGFDDTLHLKDYKYNSGSAITKKVTKPKFITTELAYILGALTGDGSLHKGVVTFRTNDLMCAEAFASKIENVFNVTPSIIETGSGYFKVDVHSVAVCSYLKQMGLYSIKGTRAKTHSHYRKVPKSILKVNAQNKLAYVAGYLDTDGNVSKSKKPELRFYSVSKRMLKTMQVILSDLGFFAHLGTDLNENRYGIKVYYLHLSNGETSKLYPMLEKYISDSRRVVSNIESSNSNYGIPVNNILPAFEGRLTKETPKGEKVVAGKTYLLNDKGMSVPVTKPYGTTVDKIKRRANLSYEDNSGLLSDLREIASVSEELTSKIDTLVSCGYKYERVVKIKRGKVKPVYDLSMGKGCRNSFVANSVVVKNCGDENWEPTPEELNAVAGMIQKTELDPMGAVVATRKGIDMQEVRQGGDFWKYTDIVDITGSLKMKALGISESFLTAESNFATAEVGLTVFMENLKAFRQNYTQHVFYNKIFPTISAVNGFYAEDVKQNQGKGAHNKVNDPSKLVIPEVHWHKALEPLNDEKTMEVLTTLEEKGIPITMRAWAAAGGMDVEDFTEDLSQDLEYRKQFAEYAEKLQAIGGESEDTEEFASILAKHNVKPKGVLNREFPETAHEHYDVTPTGKKKYVYRQAKAEAKQKKAILGAMRRLRDRSHYQSVAKSKHVRNMVSPIGC